MRTGWVNNCGGNQVVIAVGSNLYTGYYHMSKILVSPGQKIARGQQIGKLGILDVPPVHIFTSLFRVVTHSRVDQPSTIRHASSRRARVS